MGRHAHRPPHAPTGPGALRVTDAHRRSAATADDVVAIRRLPSVPPTGPQSSVVARRTAPWTTGAQQVVAPRSVTREQAIPGLGAARATRQRRGDRLHGVLIYATGVLLVLSSAYGVYSAVGGDTVLTDTASDVRNWCLGRDSDEKEDASAGIDSDGDSKQNAPVIAEGAAEPPAPEAPVVEGDAEGQDGETASGSSDPSDEASTPESSAAPSAAQPPASAPPSPIPPAGTWLSGAAGDGVTDGSLADWRGTPLDIAGTWSDNNTAMTELWQLHPSGQYGSWQKSLDIAIGAISADESWGEAADGAYDARWRESLTELRHLWAGRAGTLYIRFAHEMNGTWFDWSVEHDEADDFIRSWQRFRALQEEIFPDAQLVFGVNRDSSDNDLDWREIFPGSEYVDVMGVDYYNQYPYVDTREEWQESLAETDSYGAPKGLQAHLDFARSVGLPLSVGEWSGNADEGDSAAFMEGMHEFFAANAGSGPGQLLYEVQFNVDRDGRRWLLHGDTRMPESAEAYRRLW